MRVREQQDVTVAGDQAGQGRAQGRPHRLGGDLLHDLPYRVLARLLPFLGYPAQRPIPGRARTRYSEISRIKIPNSHGRALT